ncbi:hypothetical protein WN943_027619 [Citrus x changshan-huyou]
MALWKRRKNEVSVHYIYREANFAADFMASHALTLPLSLHHFAIPPLRRRDLDMNMKYVNARPSMGTTIIGVTYGDGIVFDSVSDKITAHRFSDLKMRAILIQQGLDAALEDDEDSKAKQRKE